MHTQVGGYAKGKKYVKATESKREFTLVLSNGETHGNYNAKTPQEAASKAYTNLCIKLKKDSGNPNFVCPAQKIKIREIGRNRKLDGNFREYSYYAERVPMSQPKTFKNRVYKYTNTLIPISKGQSLDDAKKRYQKRRQSAMIRYERENEQKIFKTPKPKKKSSTSTKSIKEINKQLEEKKKKKIKKV
jgi:hypothetical protein